MGFGDVYKRQDEELTVYEQSRRGKSYQVELQSWHNMLMRGKQKPPPIPMHQHPFTLIRIVRYHPETRTGRTRNQTTPHRLSGTPLRPTR